MSVTENAVDGEARPVRYETAGGGGSAPTPSPFSPGDKVRHLNERRVYTVYKAEDINGAWVIRCHDKDGIHHAFYAWNLKWVSPSA